MIHSRVNPPPIPEFPVFEENPAAAGKNAVPGFISARQPSNAATAVRTRKIAITDLQSNESYRLWSLKKSSCRPRFVFDAQQETERTVPVSILSPVIIVCKGRRFYERVRESAKYQGETDDGSPLVRPFTGENWRLSNAWSRFVRFRDPAIGIAMFSQTYTSINWSLSAG